MTITTAELAGPEDDVGASDRRFFTTMAVAALAVVLVGFAPSYFLGPITRPTHDLLGRPIAPSFPFIVHLHAAGFSAWILLLVAQVRLVAAGRTAVHRQVGMVAACLVPFLVVTGLMTAVHSARAGRNPAPLFPDALGFMAVPVGDLVVFAALVIAGLVFRRRPDIHKRLMLLATLGGLLPPATTRMGPVGLLVFIALVLAPAMRDLWFRAQPRWLSLLVGLGILASVPVRTLVGMSAPWRAFAAWLVN